MEKPRVFSCMPNRPGASHIEAIYSHCYLASRGGCDVIPGQGQSSLLAYSFNILWAEALRYAQAGIITHFLLHHDDIEIRTCGWLDAMLEEMQRTGAAVLSVVVPIKDIRGETSTAIGDLDNPWACRKLTLGECASLPETFCAADTPWPDRPLLLNTGVMLVDLRRKEFHRTNANGELVFYFTIQDRVIKTADGFQAQVRSEDWEFSRNCHAAGLPCYATRTIEVIHKGGGEWSNQVVVSESIDDIQGWFDFKDLYRDAVREAPEGGCLVEVGVWKGKSFCFLLDEAKKADKGLELYGVDNWNGCKGHRLTLEEAAVSDIAGEAARNCALIGYPRASLVHADSVKATDAFMDGTVDFCFIDASHDYQSVKADILAWLPKITRGGTLAGHDYNEAGVAKAVKELLPGAIRRGRCWVYKR